MIKALKGGMGQEMRLMMKAWMPATSLEVKTPRRRPRRAPLLGRQLWSISFEMVHES